ncbi:hypothetical protein EJ994_03005 [Maribacter sp. MJ134]|uniref:hypothetical protein n=1 Tax=Maribacter sp. MJ134 TaxID=2496865 RepID=UPI000F8356E9|nr:hypothetical protein [Maribacter sp. MJ134]AZQ57819.1 hypothetical protein EJ994_03005 [Maribacter sp. MJ134]
MRQLVFLSILLIINFFVKAQAPSGVWLSNDNPILQKATVSTALPGKTIMDFDTNSIGSINTRNKSRLTSNPKKSKFKIQGTKGKFKVESIGPNMLVLKGAKNKRYTFQKLDLSHKLEMGEKELQEFLVEQQCDAIQGIQGQFTKEQYYLDKKAKKPYGRYQFINYSEGSNGYWSIYTIHGNAFLIFDAGQNQNEGIFQITNVKVNGFTLLPLQNTNPMKELTSIKTCL